MGARPGQVFGLVMREGAALVAAGVVIGLALVAAGIPLVRDSLFGVGAADPVTYVLITGVLALTAIVATVVPSRAASRTDAVRALRASPDA
jgi:ABC-type antimicrobial peptide transport system permease subunit